MLGWRVPDTRGPAVHRMLLAILLASTSVLLADPEQEDPRIRSGLKERVTRRLAQFDVTVTGPLEIIADLGVEDFDLAVGGQVIDDFFLDSACDPAPSGVTDEEVTPPATRTLPSKSMVISSA